MLIDEQFLLPYGAGYDNIIKEKAEMIDSLKVSNNEVMDQLILNLGYMDYRDALACNKYIIEAKRSGDYHQVARSKILQTAMSRLARNKRDNLEKMAHTKGQEAGLANSEAYNSASADYKLNALMD